MNSTIHGLELRSLITSERRLELSLHRMEVAEPGPNEVIVRVEAAPIHPSDMWMLLGPADLSTMMAVGSTDYPIISATISEEWMARLASRVDQSMSVGNEGAGTVIKAGEHARELLGKTVALAVGGMYTQYRRANASDCLVLPEGTRASAAAACFVNPLTALSMVETMRMEGYSALVHTAAASTIGQMLNRLCLAEGIPLVNIVRNNEQVAILRDIGAQYVVNSSSADFMAELTDAIAETGATLAFDALGGGRIASQILKAMENALSREATGFSRYGSTTHKQIYIYGGLDLGPTVIERNFGMYWGVSTYMLDQFLAKIGSDRQRLEARVVAELETTFAINYTAEVSLRDMLSPEVVAAYAKRATGEKYLINPSKQFESY